MSRRRVLLIERYPDYRIVLEDLLRLNGYECRSATTLPEGWAVLGEFAADLVVLEMDQPSAAEFSRRLRVEAAVVAVVGATGGGIDLGGVTVDACFVKGANFTQILRVIEAALVASTRRASSGVVN